MGLATSKFQVSDLQSVTRLYELPTLQVSLQQEDEQKHHTALTLVCTGALHSGSVPALLLIRSGPSPSGSSNNSFDANDSSVNLITPEMCDEVTLLQPRSTSPQADEEPPAYRVRLDTHTNGSSKTLALIKFLGPDTTLNNSVASAICDTFQAYWAGVRSFDAQSKATADAARPAAVPATAARSLKPEATAVEDPVDNPNGMQGDGSRDSDFSVLAKEVLRLIWTLGHDLDSRGGLSRRDFKKAVLAQQVEALVKERKRLEEYFAEKDRMAGKNTTGGETTADQTGHSAAKPGNSAGAPAITKTDSPTSAAASTLTPVVSNAVGAVAKGLAAPPKWAPQAETAAAPAPAPASVTGGDDQSQAGYTEAAMPMRYVDSSPRARGGYGGGHGQWRGGYSGPVRGCGFRGGFSGGQGGRPWGPGPNKPVFNNQWRGPSGPSTYGYGSQRGPYGPPAPGQGGWDMTNGHRDSVDGQSVAAQQAAAFEPARYEEGSSESYSQSQGQQASGQAFGGFPGQAGMPMPVSMADLQALMAQSQGHGQAMNMNNGARMVLNQAMGMQQLPVAGMPQAGVSGGGMPMATGAGVPMMLPTPLMLYRFPDGSVGAFSAGATAMSPQSMGGQ